jgi:GGDEF domain-containing protein/CheY-like chemotaxis protein
MRSPSTVGIVEAFPGSLGGLAELLRRWGFTTVPVAVAEPGADAPPSDLLLVDAGGDAGQRHLRQLIAQRRQGGPPVAALARRDNVAAISQALALGCDEALAFPLLDAELRLRLSALAALAVAEREAGRRAALLAGYAEDGRPGSRPRPMAREPAPRAEVLLIGPASEHQVRIANGVGPATISYAESAPVARRVLGERRFDLLVVTMADGQEVPTFLPATPGLALATRDCANILAGPLLAEGAIAKAVDGGFDAVVTLPDTPEAIRMRIEFWLRLQRLRAALREPRRHAGADLALDAPSALFHEGFLLDHIADWFRTAPPRARLAVVALALTGLPEVGRLRGHALTSRLVARTGAALRRLTRPEDLPAHLGRGQFIIALASDSNGAAPIVAARLQAELCHELAADLGNEPSIIVGSGHAELRRPEEADRVLARLLRDLAWERRSVA